MSGLTKVNYAAGTAVRYRGGTPAGSGFARTKRMLQIRDGIV